MKLDFRQGIVKYPATGPTQSFLNINATTVNLDAANGPTLITFTHGNSNYLYEENVSIIGAWQGPFTAPTQYWLYWDLDIVSGLRTFGHTEIEPLIGTNRPLVPVENQHFFDTVINKMVVYTSGRWVERIRVFAAQFNGLLFTPMGVGLLGFPFSGTQIGITGVINLAGNIVFDEFGKPIKRDNKEFFTSENQFFVTGSRINSVRLESTVNIASSTEIIPKYHVVKYVGDRLVSLADYNDIETTAIGISTEDIAVGDSGNLVLSGIVSNIAWAWGTVGVNLWVSENGELVEIDPNITSAVLNPVKKPPVGRVLSSDTIIFDQGMGGIGPRGLQGIPGSGSGSGVPIASTVDLGISKLSIAPITPTSPIVVGTNDPRMTDDRNPTAHIHPATEVTFAAFGTITDPDVQLAIENLETNKLPLTGGTLTNFLTLHADPTASLHAVTKQYVDAFINGLIWIDPIFTINLIDDSLLTPPVTPSVDDVYIMPSIGTLLGGWSGFLNDDILQWDGSSWNLLGNLTTIPNGTRFGIAFNVGSVPGGTFLGTKNDIYTYTGMWTAETPVANNAVYVNNALALHGYHQFAYNGTDWIEFAGPHSVLALSGLTDVKDPFVGLAEGDVLTYNATATEWENRSPTWLENIVEDLTPQLGGNLDINGNLIETIDVSSGDADDFVIQAGVNTTTGGTKATITLDGAGDDVSNKGDITIQAGGAEGVDAGDIFINAADQTSGGVEAGCIHLTAGQPAGGGGGCIKLASENAVIIASKTFGAPETGNLRFFEYASNGTNYIDLEAPLDVGSTNRTWILPVDDPTVADGQFLTTDSNGVLSFAPVSITDLDDGTFNTILLEVILTALGGISTSGLPAPITSGGTSVVVNGTPVTLLWEQLNYSTDSGATFGPVPLPGDPGFIVFSDTSIQVPTVDTNTTGLPTTNAMTVQLTATNATTVASDTAIIRFTSGGR